MFDDDIAEFKVCCICGRKFIGHGNNPEPIKHEGLCCDRCNRSKVIKARLQAAVDSFETDQEESK